MLDVDVSVLDAPPEWRNVLLAYHDDGSDSAHTSTAETAELAARGFRPRVRQVDGVPPDQMARVHGQLIAHGLLQVEIAGRTDGMLYQLTSAGRQACLRLVSEEKSVPLELASV